MSNLDEAEWNAGSIFMNRYWYLDLGNWQQVCRVQCIACIYQKTVRPPAVARLAACHSDGPGERHATLWRFSSWCWTDAIGDPNIICLCWAWWMGQSTPRVSKQGTGGKWWWRKMLDPNSKSGLQNVDDPYSHGTSCWPLDNLLSPDLMSGYFWKITLKPF